MCTGLVLLTVAFLQEKDQRSLDLNTAKCMLGLLLGKTWPLFPVFNQFLEVSVHQMSLRLFEAQFDFEPGYCDQKHSAEVTI